MITLAELDDVTTRLGRDLTVAEQAQAGALLEAATSVICDAADKPESWTDDLNPVPALLSMMCVELVIRSMGNTSGLVRSESETLGAYSYSRTYDTGGGGGGGGGLMLTDAEGRLVRNAVYGTLTGSSTPRALHDRLIDIDEGRDVDEIEA